MLVLSSISGIGSVSVVKTDMKCLLSSSAISFSSVLMVPFTSIDPIPEVTLLFDLTYFQNLFRFILASSAIFYGPDVPGC